MSGHHDKAQSTKAAREEVVGFGSVLAPLDGSSRAERAVPIALYEARLHAVPLVFLRVVSFPEPPVAHPPHGPAGADLGDTSPEVMEARREAEAYLESVTQRYHCIAESVIIVRVGDPFIQIVRELGRWPSPLVVLTAKATSVLPLGAHSELARRLARLGSVHLLLTPVAADAPPIRPLRP
ncbi:MAG: universal stress protein [Thermomicrobiales bacterium]|nr:universal stress protein [Thermomicrobiales bacterium]